MTTDIELPDNVIAAIKANRKVAAIKLTREQLGVDLGTAKALVEDCEKAVSPPLSEGISEQPGSSIGHIILLITGVSLIYGVYKLIT